ncbi:ModD protein [bacterium]|nr:ModD protein [bacterium]
MPVYVSDGLLDRLIEEDIPYSDLTTELLDIGHKKGKILFSTREPTVVCCTEEAGRLFQKLGGTLKHLVPSGEYLPAGVDFLEVDGTAKALHAGWRVSLSLLEHISGIATRTRRIVDSAKAIKPSISVETSRKSFPGGKKLTIKAVLCGGAQPHRLGLSESVLIFRHHKVFSDGLKGFWATIDKVREKLPGKKLTMEVENEGEALMAAQAGIDIIQIDKMPSADLKEIIKKVRDVNTAVKIAAAGGITETNAAEYAATGADILVLSSVFAGKCSDIGVRIFPFD